MVENTVLENAFAFTAVRQTIVRRALQTSGEYLHTFTVNTSQHNILLNNLLFRNHLIGV